MGSLSWCQKTSDRNWLTVLYDFWDYVHKRTRRRKSNRLNGSEAEGIIDLATYYRDVYDTVKQREKPAPEHVLLIALIDLADAMGSGQMTKEDACAQAGELFYNAAVELLWEKPKQEIKR